MRTWFISRNGALTLAVIIAIGTSLALLSALATQGLSVRTVAASLLILSFIIFVFGGVLYAGRAMWNWQIEELSTYVVWERGFVITAVLATVLGLALLEDMLRAAGDSFMGRLGMVAYLFGAVVVVVAETAFVGKRDWIYSQIVLYVVLAFLAQAVFGAALLQTGIVAGWAGWATIIWNLAWLVVLLIFSPRNVYFPVLHHVAPLIIGIALLVR